MAITKEQLVAAGLEEEAAASALSAVNKVFKQTLDNNYVSKESFNSVTAKKNELQTELDESKAEVSRLKPFETQVTDLTDKVTKLETEKTELQSKYDNQAVELQKENLIKSELTPIAYDVDEVYGELDISKVVVENGKIVSGLTEQLDAAKTAKPHHFKSTQQTKDNQFLFGFKPGESSTQQNTKTADVQFAESLADSVMSMNTTSTQDNFYFK